MGGKFCKIMCSNVTRCQTCKEVVSKGAIVLQNVMIDMVEEGQYIPFERCNTDIYCENDIPKIPVRTAKKTATVKMCEDCSKRVF